MSDSKLQPMAIVAGIGVAGTMLYFLHKKYVECNKFPDVYSESGPIHLQPNADQEVRDFIAIRLEDARTAGIEIPDDKLTRLAAQHIAPGCSWEELKNTRAQQIFASIGTIVSYMKRQELGE